jgi:hypothetical protein
MLAEQKPRYFKVAVYFRGDDRIWHYHGTWEGEAASPADAKIRALVALEDVRIDGWKAEIIGVRRPRLTGRLGAWSDD